MTIREILDANRNALNRLKHSAMEVALGTEGKLHAFYLDVAAAADGAAAVLELAIETAPAEGVSLDTELVADEIGTTPEGVSVVEVKAPPLPAIGEQITQDWADAVEAARKAAP